MIAILWIVLHLLVFMLPFVLRRRPVEHGLRLEPLQLHDPWFVGVGLFFGGWYVLSAKKWFKGPVRQGTERSSSGSSVEFGEGRRPAPGPARP